MRTHPRISVAATAICNYIANGGWIGASMPWYIKECRRLRPGEYRAAWKIANKRFDGYLPVLNQRNFANDNGETF
jgi:hypothetical protein